MKAFTIRDAATPDASGWLGFLDRPGFRLWVYSSADVYGWKGQRMSNNGQGAHILAVNSSPEILTLLREIFEDEGLRVSTRIHGETRLEEITHIDPDLIILDYSSETESALLHHLTTDARTRLIPIILCTGAVRDVEAMKSQLDAMGVAVVYKPFDIEDLVRVTREALDLPSDLKLQPPSSD